MNANAVKFLADLDVAYMRDYPDGWSNYCLECSIPNSSRREIPGFYGVPFVPTEKIELLLYRNGIQLKDFLTAWIKAHNYSYGMEYLLKSWGLGHLAVGCPSRDDVVKTLDLIEEVKV